MGSRLDIRGLIVVWFLVQIFAWAHDLDVGGDACLLPSMSALYLWFYIICGCVTLCRGRYTAAQNVLAFSVWISGDKHP